MSLICWSGGCDSTLVLYDLARKASKKEPIRAISIIHPQVDAETESRKARKAILKWFKNRAFYVEHTEVRFDHKGDFFATKGDGLAQPVMWIPISTLYLRDKEDLYVGYIRTDDVWHYGGPLWTSFRNLMEVMGKEGSIYAPLEWKHKHEVLQELKRVGLLKLCWWCEDPKRGKRCGRCIPCRTHMEAAKKVRKSESVIRTPSSRRSPGRT